MHDVYILESIAGPGRYCVGSTTDLDRRIEEHDSMAHEDALAAPPSKIRRMAMCGRLPVGKSFVTLMRAGRVLPCVRPFGVAYMAAGPNAIRGVGSQSEPRARGAVAIAGFPDPRFDRFCITSRTLRQTRERTTTAASASTPWI